MALVKKDKIKKLVRKFPRKEIELERAIYTDIHPRITLNHPKVARYIKNNTLIDPILVDVALGHTHRRV